ncbi:MAG: LamG-like jellyroll fold domain-containing protein [Bacteroidales bacterium]
MKKLSLVSCFLFVALAFSTAQSPYRQRDTDQLVGHFKFSGDYSDATATLPDAVPVGAGLTEDADARPMYALGIGQTDSYLRIGDHESLDFTDAFSISFSLFLDQAPTEPTRIVSKSDPQDPSTAVWWITIYPGEGGVHGYPWSFSYKNTGGETKTSRVEWGMHVGRWNEYTLCGDASSLVLYMDIEPVEIFPDGLLNLASNDEPVLVGNCGTGTWIGKIDDLAFYRRVLTEEEIFNYYYPFQVLEPEKSGPVYESCLGNSLWIASSHAGDGRTYTFLKGEEILQQGPDPSYQVVLASEEDFGEYSCVSQEEHTLYPESYFVVYTLDPDNCDPRWTRYSFEDGEPVPFPQSSLRARYPFDGNFKDSTENTGPGLATGVSLTKDIFGLSNRGIRLSGSGSYVEIPDNPDLDIPGTFSILLSVQFEEAPEAREALLAKTTDPASGPGNYSLFVDADLRLTLGITTTDLITHSFTSEASLRPDAGNIVGVTYDGSNIRLSLNGESSTFPLPGAALQPDDQPLILGNQGAATGTCLVDNLLLYEVALDAEELEYLHFQHLPHPLDETLVKEACLGDTFYLDPQAYGHFLKAVYLKDGTILQSGPELKRQVVMETESDYGTYTWLLYNGYGSETRELEVRPKNTYEGLYTYRTCPDEIFASPGDPVSMYFYVNENLEGLEYEMYHNGVLMPEVFRGIVEIPAVDFSDDGAYHLVVINGCERLSTDTVYLNVEKGEYVHYDVPGWDWTGNISGTGDSWFSAIAPLPSGGFGMLGQFTGWLKVEEDEMFSSVTEDVFLVKYEEDGSYDWSTSLKSPYAKGKADLAADAAGNIYVCGSFEQEIEIDGTLLLDTTNTKGFLTRFGRYGDMQWIKALQATEALNCANIEIDGDNHIYLGGNFRGTLTIGDEVVSGSWDEYSNVMFLAKFDTDGNLLWLRHARTSFEEFFGLVDITLDAQGRLLATGTSTMTVDFGNGTSVTPPNEAPFLVCFDEEGTPQWATTSSGGTGFAEAFDVSVDSRNRIYLAGMHVGQVSFGDFTTPTRSGEEMSEILLARFDSQGLCTALSSYGSLAGGNDFGISYAPDSDTTGYLMGMFGDTLVLAGDTLIANNEETSIYISSNMFIARMQDDGQPLSLHSAGVKSSGFLGEILVTDDGRLYFAGLNEGLNLSKGTGSQPTIAFAGFRENGFRDDGSDTRVPETTHPGDDASGAYQVYPNPARDVLYVESATEAPFRLSLYGITGNRILLREGASRYQLPLDHLRPGTYLLKMEEESGCVYRKFIKQ